jgi:hypothetical protein
MAFLRIEKVLVVVTSQALPIHASMVLKNGNRQDAKGAKEERQGWDQFPFAACPVKREACLTGGQRQKKNCLDQGLYPVLVKEEALSYLFDLFEVLIPAK